MEARTGGPGGASKEALSETSGWRGIDPDRVVPLPHSEESIVYTHTKRLEVSEQTLEANCIITPRSTGPVVDAYKVLAIQVLQRMRENGWNTLAVIGPGSGDGKTLTAINLALSLSREVGQTVLLVDTDLRTPAVHRMFDVPGTPGLSDHLLDGKALRGVLLHPCIKDLVLLPAGRAVAGSAELLGSAKMRALVQELKHRYASRLVVFDTGAMLGSPDALAFVRHVDACLVVVADQRTQADALERSLALLPGVPILGAVLNMSGVQSAPDTKSAAAALAAAPGERTEPQMAYDDSQINDWFLETPEPRQPRASWWRRLLRRR